MRVAEIAKQLHKKASQHSVMHGQLFSQHEQQLFVQPRQMYPWQHSYFFMSPCSALFRR